MSKKIIERDQKVAEKKMEKIPITFNEDQIALIEKYEGLLGNTRAEIVRNIVINWLLEKGGKGEGHDSK